jgi:hypothetical protein
MNADNLFVLDLRLSAFIGGNRFVEVFLPLRRTLAGRQGPERGLR